MIEFLLFSLTLNSFMRSQQLQFYKYFLKAAISVYLRIKIQLFSSLFTRKN